MRSMNAGLRVWPVLSLTMASAVAAAAPTRPLADEAGLRAWVVCGGTWGLEGGVLSQSDGGPAETSHEQTGHVFLTRPALADFAVLFEFRVDPASPGVGGAELLFRSIDSRTYYVVQFSTRAGAVLLARASREVFWTDIARAGGVPMPRGAWHSAAVQVTGPEIVVAVHGREVLRARDETLRAGLLGFGSSQAMVEFRNLAVEGEEAALPVPWVDLGGRTAKTDYRVVCADAGAGGYEAFPDLCRCANGDLLCAFYAGHAHISLPGRALPRGARIAFVRSSDEGLTWSPPRTLADTPWDDRDPSLTCLRNGTVLCNWFTYYGEFHESRPGQPVRFKELWLTASTDHGATWGEPRRVPVTEDLCWGASSPIVECADGTLLWPVYREYQNPLRVWSAVLRSTDGGQTWEGPHWVDASNPDNDEPALLERSDGSLLCVMRNNAGDSMWWSESRDGGLTWSLSARVGFPGHAPYLLRAPSGVTLLGHRLPGTSLHWSLDEGRTWAGSLLVDTCEGAYPSLAALRDGSLLCVYYEEGEGSSIRARRLRAGPDGVAALPWPGP